MSRPFTEAIELLERLGELADREPQVAAELSNAGICDWRRELACKLLKHGASEEPTVTGDVRLSKSANHCRCRRPEPGVSTGSSATATRKQAMENRESKKTADWKDAAAALTTANVPAAVLFERRMQEELGVVPPILEAIEILDYGAMNGVGPDEVIGLAADDAGASMDEIEADNTVTGDDLDVCYRQLGLTSSVVGNNPLDDKISALRARLAFLLSKYGDAPKETPKCTG